jgi:hypothetical protein
MSGWGPEMQETATAAPREGAAGGGRPQIARANWCKLLDRCKQAESTVWSPSVNLPGHAPCGVGHQGKRAALRISWHHGA